MQPVFVIPVQNMHNEPRDIDVPLSSGWLADALRDTEAIEHDQTQGRVRARLSMTGRDVVVRGAVTAQIAMKCARCLQDAFIDVEGDLCLLLSPAPLPASPARAKAGDSAATQKAKSARTKKAPGQAGGGARERANADDDGYAFSGEEAGLDTYAGDEVVLDGFIREAILLELPIFPLCSEACPGIGAVLPDSDEPPAEAKPVDPRLAPLMRFRKK